ncbi:MAG: preprotein translocase subunit SecE [Limnobacter sp.]|nr:preprotein translocase subunit SecE [Limnobacter sp.]
MAQNEVTTVSNPVDKLLLVASVVLAVGGAVAYQLLANQDFFLRLGVVLGGVLLAVLAFLVSHTGKRFVAFARSSIDEARLVVWPTRKEAGQMTGIVFLFVLVMALYLLVVDKTLEWVCMTSF